MKQELKNHQDWICASLKGCRFKGRLMGCDFGHWPEYGSDPWYQHGSIEDCDFTEARLFGPVVVEDLSDQPPSTKALTYFAPGEAKRYDTTPEALRAVLEKFDCIVY